MKILNSTQLHELDEYTILNEPVESINLMERAAVAFTRWFAERFYKDQKIIIFCGPGDNGGDGLAVARMLINKMYSVGVYVVKPKEPSENFNINEERLSHLVPIVTINTFAEIPVFTSDVVIIDALFGSGLNKPVEGLFADVIKLVNKAPNTVVAIDVPSGLYLDKANETKNIIEADFTITFQTPKLAFLLPQNGKYVGEWFMLHIGLNRDFIELAESNHFYVDEQVIKSFIKKRDKFANKGDYGKALIITGSYGMLGAAVLASKGCLRGGAGLVKAYVPEAGFFVLQNDLPELIVLTDSNPEVISDIPDLSSYNAIAVGPGMGESAEASKAFEKLLNTAKIPLVIDASALNMLGANPALLPKVPAKSILTPHPKEFERIAGKTKDDYDRIKKAKELSKKHDLYIVLKGAHTAIFTPEGKIYFNSTGNPGMATAGSGDVLTGILTAMIAQGYTPLEAAIAGVFIHGYAGDSAARKLSQPSMLASDIIDGITFFYKDFLR